MSSTNGRYNQQKAEAHAAESADWNQQRLLKIAQDLRDEAEQQERRKRWEATIEEYASVEGFIADVQQGPDSSTEKAELVAIARAYQKRKAAEATERARQAAAEAAAEECQRILAAWKASDDYEAGADPSAICDEHGMPVIYAADLKHFAESLRARDLIRADEADEVTKARRWHESSGGTWPLPETKPAYTAVPRHLLLAVDRDPKSTVPPGLRGAALAKWVTEWRDGIAQLRGAELCVYAVPGQSVVFVTWWDEPRTSSQGREWCKQISPPYGEHDDPRFLAMPGEGWGERWPWRVPCPGLYLPGAYAEAVEASRATSFARSAPATKLLTGIAALDTLFRGKPGLPVGARAVIKGDPKNCKTLVALEIAEAALASGWAVVWLACDERDEQIAIRRLQRRGLSEADAQDLPEQALAALDTEGQFDLYSGASLERAWSASHATAAGRPLLVVVDSMQTVPSTAAEGKGEREGLEALVAAVNECQRKWPALFLATSEIAGAKRAPKGTGRIAYNSTTVLDVKRAGERVTINAEHGRDHRDGSAVVLVDLVGQRVLDPATAARAKASVKVQARILEVVGARGTASQTTIEADTEGHDNKRVRAELKAMAAEGRLTKGPKGYSLPR